MPVNISKASPLTTMLNNVQSDLIYFFFIWNPPCESSMPLLVQRVLNCSINTINKTAKWQYASFCWREMQQNREIRTKDQQQQLYPWLWPFHWLTGWQWCALGLVSVLLARQYHWNETFVRRLNLAQALHNFRLKCHFGARERKGLLLKQFGTAVPSLLYTHSYKLLTHHFRIA